MFLVFEIFYAGYLNGFLPFFSNQKVFKGRHFQFPQKFGPALKRGIERGIKTKVFHI